MIPHWSSIESLSKFHTCMSTASIVFIILSAIAGAMALAASIRKNSLQIEKENRFVEQIKSTNQTNTKLKKDLTELKNEHKKAQNKISELETKQKPRKLSKEDERHLLILLETYFPQKSIQLGYLSGDSEAHNFANQLFRFLLNTDFLSRRGLITSTLATGGSVPTGIIFFVADPKNVPDRAKQLYTFFAKLNLHPNFMKATPSKHLQIIIASKTEFSK